MFRVLSGVGPIMDKAEEDLTPEDVRRSPHCCPVTVAFRETSNEDCYSRLFVVVVQGLAVLTALRQLADRGVDHMTELVGQTGLVRMMQVGARAFLLENVEVVII